MAFGDKGYKARDFMLPGELEQFSVMRARGDLSFFRTDACRECECDVAKGKTYCSRKCRDKSERDERGDDDEREGDSERDEEMDLGS